MYFADSTRLIRVKLAGAVTTNQLPVVGVYQEITISGFAVTDAVPIHTVTNSTTVVTLVGSPSAGTIRVLKSLAIQNADTAAATVTVEAYDSSNARTIVKAALAVGDNLIYECGAGWLVIDASGNIKQQLVAHTLLNATLHTDTTTAGVSRGDLVTGQGASTTWNRLALGAAKTALYSDGTDAGWQKVVDVQLYTSTGSNTWTKPTQATLVLGMLIGGGAGGSSGKRGAGGANRPGGAGGGGGGMTFFLVRAAELGGTVTAFVGSGGAGGAAVTVDDTAGNAGTAGTASYFGSVANAGGGFATNVTSLNAGGTALWNGGVSGQGGTGAAGSDGTASGPGPGHGATGGGGGGGIDAGNNNYAGGAGGTGSFLGQSGTAGGTAGTAGGGTGGAGNGTANIPLGGTGGGGGGGRHTGGTGGTGGAGGGYGGGGGGGGASGNGNNSGAGGAGANGVIVILSLA